MAAMVLIQVCEWFLNLAERLALNSSWNPMNMQMIRFSIRGDFGIGGDHQPEPRFRATIDWHTFFWVRYGWNFQFVGEDPKNSKGLGRTASRVFHVLVMSRVVWQPGCQTSLGIQKSKIGEFHLPPRYITAQACSPTKSVHRLVVTLSHEHGTHKPSSECALQHFIFRWIL